MRTRKSWREKMENPDLPRLTRIPAAWRAKWGDGTMLLPAPREVEALIRSVPEGSLITVSQLREELAHRHGARTACPLLTGLFVRIAAEAAEEDAGAGAEGMTPYWRVVKDDGSLNPKLPGGTARQSERLRAEGHRIAAGRGTRPPRVVFTASA